jgi:hypothetical protein
MAPHQAVLDALKERSVTREKLTVEIDKLKKDISALEKQIKNSEEVLPALRTVLENLEIKTPVDEIASAESEVPQQGKLPILSA